MDFTVVTKYLESLKEQFSVRAADCAIMIDHKIVYRHLVGTSDFEDTVPLTEDNLHDVFSASKVLTATAVMQLVERGKIGLEDPLWKYLPEFADAKVLDDFDLQDFVASGKMAAGMAGSFVAVPCGSESYSYLRHALYDGRLFL